MPRGAAPGERRGGRRHGSKNKISLELRLSVVETLGKMKCNPIEALAIIGNNPEVKPEIRARCHAELAKYCYPQLTRTEVSGINGGPIGVKVELSPLAEIESSLARLAEREREAGDPGTSDAGPVDGTPV